MDLSTHTRDRPRVLALLARCLGDEWPDAVREIDVAGLWEHVATHACDAGLAGTLLPRLRSLGCPPPPSAAAVLQAFAEHVAAANAYRISRTARVLAALPAADVPFMLLKGAALVASLGDRDGARAMCDVDVLIRPADARRVDELLVAAGCSRGPALVRRDFYPRYYNEREYFTPSIPRVKIDLHARPLRPLRYLRTVPDDALWEAPRLVDYGPLRARIPGPTDMLIHLAAHAASHGTAELRWLYDLRLWLDRFGDEIDMDELTHKCRQWRLALPVCSALVQARDTLRLACPRLAAAIEATRSPCGPMDRLALYAARAAENQPVAGAFANVLSAPGLGFRLGYLGAVLLPDRQHLGQLYGRRHAGWPAVAHLVRLGRSVSRAFTSQAPADA